MCDRPPSRGRPSVRLSVTAFTCVRETLSRVGAFPTWESGSPLALLMLASARPVLASADTVQWLDRVSPLGLLA
eukprot:514085-Prymnesium_polylepis.1